VSGRPQRCSPPWPVRCVWMRTRLDILEWNSAAAALYTDFSLIPAGRRNYARLLFTDSVIRGMHRKWEHDARDAVAALRMEAAADPDDPELARLVGELSVQDAEFRTWWAEHRVTSSSHGTKLYRHRLVGDLTGGSGWEPSLATSSCKSPTRSGRLTRSMPPTKPSTGTPAQSPQPRRRVTRGPRHHGPVMPGCWRPAGLALANGRGAADLDRGNDRRGQDDHGPAGGDLADEPGRRRAGIPGIGRGPSHPHQGRRPVARALPATR